MNNLFQTLVYPREEKKDTVLATLIWDDGSAPRGKGSQMLVGTEGLLAGTIGGGAVELKSIRLSQELLASGGSGFIREFRLSRDGELGMACGGDVTVLFSPARLDDARWDETAAEVLRRGGARAPGGPGVPRGGGAPRGAGPPGTGGNNLFLGAAGGGGGGGPGGGGSCLV